MGVRNWLFDEKMKSPQIEPSIIWNCNLLSVDYAFQKKGHQNQYTAIKFDIESTEPVRILKSTTILLFYNFKRFFAEKQNENFPSIFMGKVELQLKIGLDLNKNFNI